MLCGKDGEEMLREDACDLVVEKYYQAIYRYCVHCLCGDVDAAEVCTQDVFLTLIEKQKKLNPDDNIRGWLYACADRITKDYLKRTARHRARCVSLASITNVQDPNALIDKSSPIVWNILNDDEYALMESYYSTAHGDREALADQLGITPAQLYRKIRAIRKKIQNS